MYSLAPILPALLACLRYLPQVNPNYPALDTDLTAPGAGKRCINDAHPLLTPEILDDLAPRADQYSAAAYVTDMAMSAGQVVRAGGRLWRATADVSPSLTPGVGVTGWEPFSPLSDVLRRALEAAAQQVIDDTLTRRKLGGVGGAIIHDVDLFSDPGSWTNKAIKAGRFVGLKLCVHGQRSLLLSLDAIGVQLAEAQPSLPLYLYAAGNPYPLAVLSAETTDKAGFTWLPTGTGTAWRALEGGTYYLGYYEDDLTGQAIIRKRELSRAPCGNCNPYNPRLWNQYAPFLRVSAVRVEPDGLLLNDDNSAGLDFTAVQEVSDSNWGLNLRVAVRCELTDFLTRNAGLLAEPIRLQTAVNLLRALANSTRTNPEAENARQLAAAELAGKSTLLLQLEAALKALVFDTSGFDERCLPCVPVAGAIRVRAV